MLTDWVVIGRSSLLVWWACICNTTALTSVIDVTSALSISQFQCRVCWIHHVTGMWVYPFLEHIGSGARIIFFGSTTILMNFLYLLGEVLNSYIWDTQRSKYPSGHIKHEQYCLGDPWLRGTSAAGSSSVFHTSFLYRSFIFYCSINLRAAGSVTWKVYFSLALIR